jgi:hypothetical protein
MTAAEALDQAFLPPRSGVEPQRRGRGREGLDPVGTADRLRRGLAERLGEILADGPAESGDDRATGRATDKVAAEAAAGGAKVYVSWYPAQEADACPARYRAQGEEGWGFPGWSAPLASASIGRAALDHHLDAHDRGPLGPSVVPPRPAPLEAVRAWMRAMATVADCPVGEWVAERITQRDDAAVAAAAAGATRWLAGFVRVLGWPLPDRLRVLSSVRGPGSRPLRWHAPRLPVTVAAGADARLGRVTGSGEFALVVHRVTGGHDERLRDRAAFEAAAGALAIGVTPEAVVITAGDTGERVRVVVEPALLDRGADLVAGVVRQRAVAVERGFDAADASPSPGCRHCPQLGGCTPGRDWLAGPGRWRGGLPVL